MVASLCPVLLSNVTKCASDIKKRKRLKKETKVCEPFFHLSICFTQCAVVLKYLHKIVTLTLISSVALFASLIYHDMITTSSKWRESTVSTNSAVVSQGTQIKKYFFYPVSSIDDVDFIWWEIIMIDYTLHLHLLLIVGLWLWLLWLYI